MCSASLPLQLTSAHIASELQFIDLRRIGNLQRITLPRRHRKHLP